MHDALMFPSFNPDKTYLQHQKDGLRSMVMIASGAVHDSINTYPDYTFAAHPAQVEFIALLTTIWYNNGFPILPYLSSALTVRLSNSII